jgi:conjugal transfer pilus assembly protein TraE
MKNILRQSRIQYLIQNRNGYLLIASISLVANIILAMGMINAMNRQKVILVPPTIERTLWVTSDQVSPEYLSSMSLFLADLLLNVTPDNIAMQHQLFLKYVDSSQYGTIKSALISEEDHLKKEHMTMTFHLAEPRVNAKSLMTHITGDIQYVVGNTLISNQRLTYAFTFIYRNGLLKVKSFEEVKAHA